MIDDEISSAPPSQKTPAPPLKGERRARKHGLTTMKQALSATQKSYFCAVTRLAKYHKKAPDQLSKEDIRACVFDENGRRAQSATAGMG